MRILNLKFEVYLSFFQLSLTYRKFMRTANIRPKLHDWRPVFQIKDICDLH